MSFSISSFQNQKQKTTVKRRGKGNDTKIMVLKTKNNN